jgi:hypothetical protein
MGQWPTPPIAESGGPRSKQSKPHHNSLGGFAIMPPFKVRTLPWFEIMTPAWCGALAAGLMLYTGAH